MNISSTRPYTILLFGIFLFLQSSAFAQGKRYTEEEINTQKIFIDANREKLLGRYEEASVLYVEVLKRDKENHAAAYELARVYDVLDKDDKALQSIKIAIEFDKENLWYQLFLADVLEKLQKFKEAANVYEKLAQKNKDKIHYIYTHWAFYLVKANEIPKAIKVYDELESKIGVSEEIINKKHILYLGLGNNKKATVELEKLVKYYPSNIDYHHSLAEFYLKTNEKQKASETYQQVLKLDPNDARASMAAAGKQKQGGGDITYLNSLHPIFKNPEVNIDVKVKELIPFIQKITQSPKPNTELGDAITDLAQILEQVHPDDAKSYSLHGDILYYTDHVEIALEKYEKTLQYDKTVFSVWEQIMFINGELGNMEALAKRSEEAMDYFPNHSKVYYFNGIANNEIENYKSAINSYQQALMMSGKQKNLKLDIHRRMGETYFHLNKAEKSEQSFEKALALNPKDINLLNTYAYTLAETGELKKAKTVIITAKDLKPNYGPTQNVYGRIFYKMKDYAEAKRWIEKALENGGQNSASTLENYGDVLFQLGEIENAIGYWQKAQIAGNKTERLNKKIMDKKLYE